MIFPFPCKRLQGVTVLCVKKRRNARLEAAPIWLRNCNRMPVRRVSIPAESFPGHDVKRFDPSENCSDSMVALMRRRRVTSFARRDKLTMPLEERNCEHAKVFVDHPHSILGPWSATRTRRH